MCHRTCSSDGALNGSEQVGTGLADLTRSGVSPMLAGACGSWNRWNRSTTQVNSQQHKGGRTQPPQKLRGIVRAGPVPAVHPFTAAPEEPICNFLQRGFKPCA